MFRGSLATVTRGLGRWRAAGGLAMFMALGFTGVVHAASPVATGVVRLSGFVGAVQLEGWLHVVVLVPPNPTIPATIHANLPTMDVIATDLVAGRNYLAHGAGKGVCQPTDPCNGAIAGFSLQRVPAFNEVPGGGACAPVDPCEPIPFTLNLSVFINGDGSVDTLLSSAEVQVCGVDVCL